MTKLKQVLNYFRQLEQHYHDCVNQNFSKEGNIWEGDHERFYIIKSIKAVSVN